MLRIVVPGPPQPKLRPRVVRRRRGNGDTFLAAITPEKTVIYENLVALAGRDAMQGNPLLEGPLAVTMFAHFAMPKSWSKKRRATNLIRPEYHTVKPDCDNMMKVIDGLNGVVWHDDKQVAQAQIVKIYSETPQLIIEVRPL